MLVTSERLGSSRIVVLGSHGFIGGSVISYLDHLGVAAVGLSHADVDARDKSVLARYLMKGDVVVNAVGYARSGDESSEGQRLCSQLNVDVPVAAVSACAAVGALQFIHLSSVAAMGHLEGRVSDINARGRLVSSYAKSKRSAEDKLRELSVDVPVTVLRPTSVFGPGRPLARQLCHLSSFPVVPLPGGGGAKIPFTDVNNICAAIADSIAQPATYERTFIVGDSQSYSLRFLIGRLRQALHAHGTTVSLPSSVFLAAIRSVNKLRTMTGRERLIDASKLLTLTTSVEYDISPFVAATGYTPLVSIEEGLAAMAAWYRRVECGPRS